MNRNFLVTGGAQGIGLAYCRFPLIFFTIVVIFFTIINISIWLINLAYCRFTTHLPLLHHPCHYQCQHYHRVFSRTILSAGGNVFFTDINEEQVLIRKLFPPRIVSHHFRGDGSKYQLGFSGKKVSIDVLEIALLFSNLRMIFWASF